MTWSDFDAFAKGVAARHGSSDGVPSDEEYLAVMAEEMAAGRA